MIVIDFLDHITINNPKVIEDYVNAMEESANRPISHEASDIKFETDPNALKELMLKGIEKWGESDLDGTLLRKRLRPGKLGKYLGKELYFDETEITDKR